jgi:hypothetical protein
MTEFCVKLAGVPCRLRTIYPEQRRFLQDYLCEEEPRFTIEMSREDLAEEARLNDENRAAEGLEPQRAAPRNLESLAIYRKLALCLLEEDVLLFHGSVIAVDGEGYLFTARSGTGKSTHTRLWREAFGDRAVMINDDKPLLRVTEQGVTVYGTPWNGKHHLSCNLAVPLKAICHLTRAEENRIVPLSAEDAFPILFQQCYRPRKAEAIPRILELLERLSRQVKLYRLGCNMEPEAAIVSYTGMQEEKT